ncbi:MAG: hypothetical protein WCC60_00905, partial [Ilumatobacteraceae bacterium]
MEISEQTLRALVADTDAQHREGMVSLPDDLRALHSETRRFRAAFQPSARRSALHRTGAATGVVAIGSQLLPVSSFMPMAFAAGGDAGIAAFAESVELTAVAAY